MLRGFALTLRYKTSGNSVCVHIPLHPSYKSTDVGVPPAEIDHGLNLSDHNCGHLVQWKCDVPTAVGTIVYTAVHRNVVTFNFPENFPLTVVS